MPRTKWLNERIEVEWNDSCVEGGWKSRKAYEASTEASVCRSIGFMLKNTRDRIVLVQQQSDGGNVSDSITIPKGCIRKIRRLR